MPGIGAIKALVIEDDPLFTKLVTSMLQTRGCAVLGAASAEEGIEALKAHQFDVVITDLNMEGMGGIGLIRSVIGDQSFPITRILVITGEPANSADSSWVVSQNISILRKPFGLKSLLAAVDTIVQS